MLQENILSIKCQKRLSFFVICVFCILFVIVIRLIIIVFVKGDYYRTGAADIQERERSIKAARGLIYDRNGVVLAGNEPVCSISVVHNQITDSEEVISTLSEKLGIPEETIRKKVEKVSSREKIKNNVPKNIGDEIRELDLDGVIVDDDYKRYYPYDTLASKVVGFTGGDNQGILGLEVYYDSILQGTNGTIRTPTDIRGIEIKNLPETRIEPIAGNNLVTSIDVNIQNFLTDEAMRVLKLRNAKRVCIVMMNPQNGEIYGMVDVPEYNLNEPFTLNYDIEDDSAITDDMLNQMWRNFCINDSYEPGSTFKIVTATAALEEGKVSLGDQFYCPGYRVVSDRRIRCSSSVGHGQQDFKHGIMNSCNPVFMEIGERLGAEDFYKWLENLGLFEKTGIDLPGEAGSIFHKQENVGPVELATMSFGQSFQITPLQLLRAVSAVVNGGNLVTPHFGMYITDENNNIIDTFEYDIEENVVSEDTSSTMCQLLEAVVSEGTGKRGYVEGFHIGGKTATSEKLPRRSGKYISSFLGFAPADNPKVITLILIDEPEGTYYGGTIAAPVVGEIYENLLPYLGIDQEAITDENIETIYFDDGVF